MADTMLSENRYRKYLEDDSDTYLKPEPSSTDKLITGGIATVGLAGGGILAYKNGLMKGLMHGVIKQAGNYRRGKAVGLNSAVRRFSEDKDLDKLGSAMKNLAKGNLQTSKDEAKEFVEGVKRLRDYKDDAFIEHEKRMKEIGESKLIDKEFDAHRRYSNSQAAIETLKKSGASDDELILSRKLMDDDIANANFVSDKEQALKMKQTGYRFATVQDLIEQNELSVKEQFVEEGMRVFAQAGKKKNDFLKTKVDDNILVDADGNIADLRDFRKTFAGTIHSLSTDFTIPLVKINPLRMFYLDQVFTPNLKPFYHVAQSFERQPIITEHNGSTQRNMLFVNGKVFGFNQNEAGETITEELGDNIFLADAKKGPIARLLRNMAGITVSKFDAPKADDPFLQRAKYHLGSAVDVGFQDEPGGQLDWLDPTSWPAALMNIGTERLSQSKYQKTFDHLSNAFGQDAEYIFMRGYKPIKESEGIKDYFSQYTAGRKNMNDVTMATLFPYGFFERLNATLNQVNLGLSNEALGSGFDIFKNLLLKRVAPIWAGVELFNYLNYESENLMGEQMSDRMAKMYVNSSVEMAQIRDNWGITDWAKGVAPLFVGGEQIADIPVVGQLFDLNDSEEETQEYWENGEDAVRRGRWWPLGNTPYTGMTIDHFEPNWVRRVLSDYKFSDSQYGSREEYFENSWMPTPRHPLAPIRHFFTDPYHYEEKHYLDRPYPVTGGIAELEDFPLIGPALNATIGQLLKPPRTMHTEDYGAVKSVENLEELPIPPVETMPAAPPPGGLENVDPEFQGTSDILRLSLGPSEMVLAPLEENTNTPQLAEDIAFSRVSDGSGLTDEIKDAWIRMYDTMRQQVPVYLVTPENYDDVLKKQGVPEGEIQQYISGGGGAATFNTASGQQFITMGSEYYNEITPAQRRQVIDHELFHSVFNEYYENDPRLTGRENESAEEHISLETAAWIGASIVNPSGFDENIAEGLLNTYRNSEGLEAMDVEYVDFFDKRDESIKIFTDYAETLAPAEAAVSETSEVEGDGEELEIDGIEGPAVMSYVTTGGDVQVLRADDEDAIWDARAIMDTNSPMKTGQFSQVRANETWEAEPIVDDVSLDPLGWQQTVGNLHSNITEMGGFYGFMSQSVSGGELFTADPVLESSTSMNSYTRAFWDLDIGGFGGDANEIFRRFLPKDRKINEVNAIQNTMPDFLPGSSYYVDFQTGDPYTKVKKGEMRMPGEGYERLHGINMEEEMEMSIGGSFIGYDPQTIREHLLKQDAYKDEALQKILDAGTKIHAEVEASLLEQGVIDGSEGYVRNEEHKVGGFYDLNGNVSTIMDWMGDQDVVDFRVYHATEGGGDARYGGNYVEVNVGNMDEMTQGKYLESFMNAYGDERFTGDIKTRGEKQFNKGGIHYENLQQINFYATELDTPINFIIESNRDRDNAGLKVYAFETSQKQMDETYQKVEMVRENIRQGIETGEVSRGEFYSPLEKYRILSDVAPYSEELRQMKSQISNMGLTDEEMLEVRKIDERARDVRTRNRFYDYRFHTANVENQYVTVDHMIDANTFVSKEHPDNPIRLAGLHVSTDKTKPESAEALAMIEKTIKEGSRVKISVDGDEENRIKNDTYQTIQAVVYDNKGRNLNHRLIESGLAKENENDYSAAAVNARFTNNEIQFGSIWERFAHLDTILHTKLLQVRSPLESYERRELYGKNWQEWTDPVDDYLIPAIQNGITNNPLLAIGAGAIAGAMFGSLKPSDVAGEIKVMGKYGKIVGGTIGASVMGMGVMYRMLSEAMSGEAWIPERRQEERDVEEYFDVLKYIKSNALFDKYADIARKREGFDVERYLEEEKSDGEFRAKRRGELEEIKRMLYVAKQRNVGDLLKRLEKDFNIAAPDKETAMTLINKELETLSNTRKLENLTPNAARAILHKQAADKTMYGYDQGDPLSNILAALPKKDRQYLAPFIKAPEEERERILDIVPDYMKRPLQSAWGKDVDEKESLEKYFQGKPLPGKKWAGWQEHVSLDDIKVKYVDRVGLDPSEFDMWEDDIQRSRTNDTPVPDIVKGRESASSFLSKIKGIFEEHGVKGGEYDIVENDTGRYDLQVDMNYDRRRDIQDLMNREGHNVI